MFSTVGARFCGEDPHMGTSEYYANICDPMEKDLAVAVVQGTRNLSRPTAKLQVGPTDIGRWYSV